MHTLCARVLHLDYGRAVVVREFTVQRFDVARAATPPATHQALAQARTCTKSRACTCTQTNARTRTPFARVRTCRCTPAGKRNGEKAAQLHPVCAQARSPAQARRNHYHDRLRSPARTRTPCQSRRRHRPAVVAHKSHRSCIRQRLGGCRLQPPKNSGIQTQFAPLSEAVKVPPEL